jgi:hypothetical protein
VKTLDLRAASRRVQVQVPDADADRGPAIATWRGRMVNETLSSAVFTQLGRQVAWAGLGAPLSRACEEFAREERRHGVLCGAVVEALGGEAFAELPAAPAFPMHEDVSPVEGVLRNVLSISCLSETVAVSLIGAEREEMPEGELRELLTTIWADEIGHSRFGWSLVAGHAPALGRPARARLGAYLRVAFRHLEEHELSHLPESTGAERADLGLCDGRTARALFHATVTDVIVPRLESLGLPADAAWRSRRQRALQPLDRCA